MSWQELSIDAFFERLADMPEIEAVQEIDLRLSRIVDQRRTLLAAKDRQAAIEDLETLNIDEAKLRSERHLVIMRMDRKKWSKAVRALWGQEGLEQCLIWFETMGEPDLKQVALLPQGASHG